MAFSPDLFKQAQEIIFSREIKSFIIIKSIIYNTVPIACTTCRKHLGLYIDEKLNFCDHINAKLSKANKRIGIIKKFSNTLSNLS